MIIAQTISEMRSVLDGARKKGRVGFVPTMGALHEGHISLIRLARKNSETVVASVFVNPSQFEDPNDFAHYPSTLDQDIEMLMHESVDLLFLPSVKEIYPDGDQTIIEVQNLSARLQGELRPGHFQGVTTVVARLFNIVQPDCAVFGEKDFQQLQIIRRMVRDLAFPIKILSAPTFREPDGLAMSSRNRRLSPEERSIAPVLFHALEAGEKILKEKADFAAIRQAMRVIIEEEPLASLKRLDIVDAETLLDPVPNQPVVLLLSVEIGNVLLIDQRVIFP